MNLTHLATRAFQAILDAIGFVAFTGLCLVWLQLLALWLP